MAMAEEETTTFECGFCLRTDSDMDDPRVLPCNHVHCGTCLKSQFTVSKQRRCPYETCLRVFEASIEDLESKDFSLILCDLCEKKGRKEPAVGYCAECQKKFCELHYESHDEFSEDHKRIPIESYRSEARKLEVRKCSKHPDLDYVRGCRKCKQVYCAECIYHLKNCSDGEPHLLLPLDELVRVLNTDLFDLVARMIDKEAILADLSKQTIEVMSEYNEETEHLLGKVHEARERQITALSLEYESLGDQLVEARTATARELNDFLEEKVEETFQKVNKLRLRIVGMVQTSHQVDIVTKHDETMSKMQTEIDKDIPKLHVTNVKDLKSRAKSRTIEVALTDRSISIVHEHKIQSNEKVITVPKSLTLLKSVVTTSHCRSAFLVDEKLYAGLYNEPIVVIDPAGKTTSPFPGTSLNCDCIIVYKERIYALIVGMQAIIFVYDMSGQIVTSWQLIDSTPFTKMAIVNDWIVVPDRTRNLLTVFTLNGKIVKNILCEFISNTHICMCSLSESSVAISEYKSNKVHRIDVVTKQALWTATVAKAEGMALYGKDYLFVAREDCSNIAILNSNTGEVIRKINSPNISPGFHIFDLHISGNTLVVPQYCKNGPVLFFRIE